VVRLYEFQGKQLLREAGVKVPRGEVASTKEEAKAIAEKIGGPVVIKAQIWATGRSKAGGIKFAENPDEAEERSQELLKASLRGHTIEKVLVEERIDIDMEFYAGVIAESSYKVKGPVMIFSSKGGVDIE
jgi:succinyl-CoA synthetase beta subunit